MGGGVQVCFSEGPRSASGRGGCCGMQREIGEGATTDGRGGAKEGCPLLFVKISNLLHTQCEPLQWADVYPFE